MPAVIAAAGGTAVAERWTDAGGVLAVAVLGAAYGHGVQGLWLRRGRGAVVPRWRAAAFTAGLAVVLAAQHGPVHEAAERTLAGHMAQHMLLMLVAAPLLALGAAALPLTLALPHRLRRPLARLRAAAVTRTLRRPTGVALVAAGLHTAVLWCWHLPVPYRAAVQHPVLHGAEHATLVAAGWLLWSRVLGPARHRVEGPVGFLLLFAAAMPAAALGAVLTFAPVPVYPAGTPTGPDPLHDQQLAGLVMWVPMDVAMGAAAVVLFLVWLTALDRRAPGGHDLRPGRPLPRAGEPAEGRPA